MFIVKISKSFVGSSSIKKFGFDINNLTTHELLIIVGAGIFVLSIIEILILNSGLGIVALFIGVILLCVGLYKTRDVKETEERTRIIREHLLTLPEEYYVFYNLKTPTSTSGINHLVVGPTGIYAWFKIFLLL